MGRVLHLTAAEWRAREAAHQQRVDALTAGHLERRANGEKHPVIDFLFDYYGQTPGKLRRWHPGPGIALQSAAPGPRAEAKYARADGGLVTLDVDAFLTARGKTVAFVRAILSRTLDRPAQTGCFGLHEWAMVYRQPQERRHQSWPLRLGGAGTDAVVEAATLRCTHFDATRFFTPQALPRNTHAPTRATQIDDEQPGCLHAGMDLYRWAFKLAPGISSGLILEAFELALEIRTLDMQASPYDLRALGYAPVAIETAAGKRAYAERQREFAERGNALRRKLLDALAVYGPLGPPAPSGEARPLAASAAIS